MTQEGLQLRQRAVGCVSVCVSQSPPKVFGITVLLEVHGSVCVCVCVYEKSSVIALSIHIRPQHHVGLRLKWLPLL